ncbi:MAG: MASE1 domain-containing protein [Betaproteobacteria bacterium]
MSIRTILWNVGVALAYIAASEAVAAWLRLSHIPPIIWYASGVGLAALLLRGLSVLPGIVVAAFVCSLLAEESPELGLLLTLAVALQLTLAWWLLTRVLKFDATLRTVRDVLVLIAVGCTVVPVLNAMIMLLRDYWRGVVPDPGELVRTQVTAMGEFVGILLVAPVVLATTAAWGRGRPWSRHIESLILQVANAAVALVVFGGMMAPSMSAESLPYAIFPFTYWAAFRLGMRDTALALLVAGTIAVGCHSLGVGPFVMPGMSSANAFGHYASLYLFLIVLSTTSLLAAATQQQREAADARAREHLNQLAHVARVASMGEMASAIAHEVNQPLTAIANYASASLRLMQADKMSPAEAIAVMQQLADESERAGEVVRKMRGFVRGEEGRPVRIPVAELFADVLRLSGPEARAHGVTLDTGVVSSALTVTADVIQLQQVLLNLVRNAIEAIAAADSTTRRVVLDAMPANGGMVEMQVTDSGPGVAAADLDRVFTAFHTTKPDGVGIGLALTRSIVEAYGGRVWTSPAAAGAVFHLTMPTA